MLNERWHDPEIIDQFAKRETDHRLRALIEGCEDPASLKVLDLGCAAGRNTVYLAAKGCDVHAADLSEPMVQATRERLAPWIGEAEAVGRVVVSPMDDLSIFGDGSFDLIVALGIYHQATSVEEWERAIDESVRVLRQSGRLLVASFAPGTDLTGEAGRPVEGSPHLFVVRDEMPAVLFDAEELDARLLEAGLSAETPTETVEREHEPAGRRVTVNGLYRKL